MTDSKVRHIYVFRHGETDWNRNGRLQGHTDIPLNGLGREQARQLIPVLREKQVEVIFSSDLHRARETAGIVAAELNLQVLTHPGLREANLGQAEGLTYAEIAEKLGAESLKKWGSFDPADLDWGFPEGETKRQQVQRMLQTLEQFLHANPYERVAVATHGGVIRRVVGFCRPELREPITVPNCSLFHFEYHPDARNWVIHLT